MRRDHRMLSQPVAVVAFVLALAAPAGAADLIPDEGCGYGCDGRAAGYAFAARNNIADAYDCEGHGSAFFAGCADFVEEHRGNQPWGAPVPGNRYAQPYDGQPYSVPPPNAGDTYAAPAEPGNGYGSPDEQYDEPQEQGDGGPQPY
jgi:hypothetical protein